MPHNELEPSELDEVCTSLEAVDDLGLDDFTRLEDESIYSAGMVVVQAILRDMAATGRTRYAGPADAGVGGGEAAREVGSRAPDTATLSRRSDRRHVASAARN